MLITFLEAPLLAIILGYFTKYISGTDLDPDAYVFAENINLIAYNVNCSDTFAVNNAVYITTNIANNNFKDEIIIYPNPTSLYLQIESVGSEA